MLVGAGMGTSLTEPSSFTTSVVPVEEPLCRVFHGRQFDYTLHLEGAELARRQHAVLADLPRVVHVAGVGRNGILRKILGAQRPVAKTRNGQFPGA